MRLYLILPIYAMFFYILFSQTYNYDKVYESYLDKNGVVINNDQKSEVRKEILKWTKAYLNKEYNYGEKVSINHPITKNKKEFRFDCSGYIAAVYWTSNVVVFDKQAVFGEGGVKTIHATLNKYNKLYTGALPNAGDIIMFDRTTSASASLSHAGIVISVDKNDGTITFAHASTSRGLTLGYMNLKYPTLSRKDGKIINSYLKRGGGVDALASKCFNSFGTVLDIPNK